MSPPSGEDRILMQIERMLREGDRAFARRIDALNAARPARAGRCFSCPVTRREIVYVVLATLTVALVPVCLAVVMSEPSCRPRPPRPAASSIAPTGAAASCESGRTEAEPTAARPSRYGTTPKTR
ncbi:hypothetical protein [Planobispora takensis]|uniref:DUF3040 domain-containing protein n=1 Tax=Planobispora takensis TaxID=1367882 RepID=A0A8J3WYN6_9ACTN|nr:hypothetical protein [Planobispora takensis]GII03967.1 hypothetical protein Pta02_59750 [Planobispora takensis]